MACLFCALVLASCGGRQGADGQPTDEGGAEHIVECHTVEVDGGYGYLITVDADTLIYQPFIPAIGGFKPFATAEQAARVGRRVVERMLAGEPPALTPEEVNHELQAP